VLDVIKVPLIQNIICWLWFNYRGWISIWVNLKSGKVKIILYRTS